jgi:serine/threonine protein kinase
MDYQSKWKIIEELGEGGQGKVYRVIDLQKFTNIIGLPKAIQILSNNSYESAYEKFIEKFGDIVLDFVKRDNPNNQGALKILHQPKDARDYERAEERIKREIEAMTKLSHPNLLKILDDDDSKWFVSQYHFRGTLANNLSLCKGSIRRALHIFRPLVEGVSLIHEKGLIHRDIKPQNVFLGPLNNLILGDFGIVFFIDDQHSRISATLDNVGSRDWMPGWAMGVSIEELRPSFDVFSLGKLLWSMISGQPFLRLWYFNRPEYNLEEMFPNNRFMRLINKLLSKCVVENEKDCLPNAGTLLDEIDKIQHIVEENASLIGRKLAFLCMVCGVGHYVNIEKPTYDYVYNFGLRPASGHSLQIYSCNHCGNVQIFDFQNSIKPPFWEED